MDKSKSHVLLSAKDASISFSSHSLTLSLSHSLTTTMFSPIKPRSIHPSSNQPTWGKSPSSSPLSKTTNPQKTQKTKPPKRRGDRKSAHTIQQDPLLAILKTPASAMS
jgi:hypothetical protein